MIVCAGKIETFNFATPVGIGLTDVSINLTKLCMEKKPEFLLFVGSAGSYGEKQIFEIIESKTACNIENSFLEGHSYTPIDNVITAADPSQVNLPNIPDVSRETRQADDNSLSSVGLKPERWSNATRGGRETLVNCSNYVTSNSHYAKQYLKKNIHLENMEFYAVLKVAEKFGIPAGGVFIVTNFCDENAHEDFKKNHKIAMQKLAAYMNEKNRELRI
ncbi:phosphorylase family protein [Sulfurovum mangrovi]|uniref:phosphorylase family protein n=1 Tax=Sulfurovum mangrovi TaxID=2893889 RepID=UPI001E4F7EE8|nr:purine-nucleoside phosphorylase [Sulfurovum mangrovi]UFH59238.1 purine-nucleoside phosphorylase [Sulfurovum mangrovi]